MEGFLAPRPFRPTTLALVVAGHAAVLTAVILAKSGVFVRTPDVTVVRWIPDTPEPPPLPPPPPETAADPRPAQVDRPQREVVIPPVETTTTFDFKPVIDAQPPIRATDPPTPPLPPARTPVLVDAQPARGDFQPAYPPALQRAEIEGKAVVRVLIGTDGRVHAVEIVSADDPAFAEATRRQALRAWRFKPATRDGVAVESWRTMTVHFRMDA